MSRVRIEDCVDRTAPEPVQTPEPSNGLISRRRLYPNYLVLSSKPLVVQGEVRRSQYRSVTRVQRLSSCDGLVSAVCTVDHTSFNNMMLLSRFY